MKTKIFFVGEKLKMDYVIHAKSQKFHAKFFFHKIYIRAQKQVFKQKMK